MPNSQQMPSMLLENDARRERWAPITGGSKADPHKKVYEHGIEAEAKGKVADPSWVRRATEIALEAHLHLLAGSPAQGGIGRRDILNMPIDKVQEAIDSSAIAPFQKFTLGIIRRVMPKLILDGLVSTQPMPLPSAPIFYLDYKYGTAKAPTAIGDRIDLISSRNETYAGGRFYDNVGTGDGTGSQTFNAQHAGTQAHQVFFDGVEQASPGLVVNAGAGPGGVDEFVFTPAPALNANVIVSYTGYAELDTPRDINLSLESEIVTAEDLALRAGFTVQTMQDAMAYHSIDVDAELTNAMAHEIYAELDALILLELFQFAGAGNVNFNTGGYLPGDTSTADRKAYDATLYDAINNANNLIWTLRHQNATWIVGGTDAIQALENIEQFTLLRDTGMGMDNYSDARHRVPVGILGGMGYMVYKDARMPSNKLLLGYRGPSPFHVGYVYAPYVMLYQTGLIPDPSANFNMRKGLLHRAGRKRVDMNLYATVTLT